LLLLVIEKSLEEGLLVVDLDRDFLFLHVVELRLCVVGVVVGVLG
jgi:hypothetical protein